MDIADSTFWWAALRTTFSQWGLVSVWVPALTPMFGVALILLCDSMRARHQADRIPLSQATRLLASPYVDGQLGYVAIAWCAVGLFEMWTLESCVSGPYYGVLTFSFYCLGFMGGLIAACGALPSHAAAPGPGDACPELVTPRTLNDTPFAWSLSISVATCFLLSTVHTSLDASLKGDLICQKALAVGLPT